MEVSGQLHASSALPPGKEAPATHWIGNRVGPGVVLDAVVKRKTCSPRRESNPRTSIVQPKIFLRILVNKLMMFFIQIYVVELIVSRKGVDTACLAHGTAFFLWSEGVRKSGYLLNPSE
jgi:hypothetical protein